MENRFLHNADCNAMFYNPGQWHTLQLRSPYHDGWGHEDWVVYDGCEIVWTPHGTIIYIS